MGSGAAEGERDNVMCHLQGLLSFPAPLRRAAIPSGRLQRSLVLSVFRREMSNVPPRPCSSSLVTILSETST